MNYTTSDIAELLDLTQYTVKRHLKRMNLEKHQHSLLPGKHILAA